MVGNLYPPEIVTPGPEQRKFFSESLSPSKIGLRYQGRGIGTCQALAVLASVSAAREKWDDVEHFVSLMEKLCAASPEVLVAAAEIAATWGEGQRAVRYLEQAEKLSPRHPFVLKLRAKLGK
jgi:hypothetical protein